MGRNMNPGPIEYEANLLPTQPRPSVIYNKEWS
jgi:hypothetical protein